MRNRIKAIRGYMRHLPGSIGIVIYNRKNGAIWHNANAGVSYPAASTMKLAMMTDILQRSDAGSSAAGPRRSHRRRVQRSRQPREAST